MKIYKLGNTTLNGDANQMLTYSETPNPLKLIIDADLDPDYLADKFQIPHEALLNTTNLAINYLRAD